MSIGKTDPDKREAQYHAYIIVVVGHNIYCRYTRKTTLHLLHIHKNHNYLWSTKITCLYTAGFLHEFTIMTDKGHSTSESGLPQT